MFPLMRTTSWSLTLHIRGYEVDRNGYMLREVPIPVPVPYCGNGYGFLSLEDG